MASYQAVESGTGLDRASQRWKWVALPSLFVAACLAAFIAVSSRAAHVTDDRLIGIWQSDADRTIAGIRDQRPVDDAQEVALRNLFGKLRITYTPNSYTTELDGSVDTYRYEVLGTDKHSIVIRDIGRKPSPWTR